MLVPTMGALHEGHASLIRRGVQIARERHLGAGCVVTIFVNPTQFTDPSDFERYPRTFEADAGVCRKAGASCVYAPRTVDVYPGGSDRPGPAVPRVGDGPGLEDAARPGHFAGVVQVVARLFEMTRPAAAVFGEKDWQQLQVVRSFVARDRVPVDIVAGETVRDADGLALSSRNRFLSGEDRSRATALGRALKEAGQESSPSDAETRMRAVLSRAGVVPDYCVVRDAETLEAARPGSACRALVAARVGSVRLIDNASWHGR